MNKHRKRKLHEVYATVPTIDCQGKCTDYCGAIGMEKGELEEMKKASGSEPNVTKDLTCNYLENGRCSIYADRPLICRIWGVIEDFSCPHGCRMTRKLAPTEIINLFAKVKKIAGDGTTYKNCEVEEWQRDLKVRSKKSAETHELENILTAGKS